MAARQIVLNAICETPVVVSTKAAGLIEVSPNEDVAETHTAIIARTNTNMFPGCPFNVNIAVFSKVDVYLPDHRNFGEVANLLVKIVHIKDERFLHLPGAHESINDSSVNSVQYKPTPTNWNIW